MSKASKYSNNCNLVSRLQELGNSPQAKAAPHPIKHDASAIDHPLWPTVSFLGRDHSPGLFEELNPFFLICRPSEEPSAEDATYLVEGQTRIMAGVIHFTDLLQLKCGSYFKCSEKKEEKPDMQLAEVVFNFLNRPAFTPIIFDVSKAKGHPKFWFSFVASSWMEGFLDNVMAISRPGNTDDVELNIDYSILNNAEPHEATFMLRDFFKDRAPTTVNEMTELCSTWMKAKQAEDRKLKRHLEGVKPRQNACRSLLLNNWLVDALWCRTTAGIVSRYDNTLGVENAEDHEAVCSRMEKEISNLKLSVHRRTEYNEVIEKAEKLGFAQLSKS